MCKSSQMHLVLQLEQFLEQQHGNAWHPVEYFSKRLNDTESRYSASEREILCCILAMEHWYPYLVGRAFDVLN